MSSQVATLSNTEFAAPVPSGVERLPGPAELAATWPLGPVTRARISAQRQAVRDILTGRDDRLMVIVGPCSLHDPRAAVDYGRRLAGLAGELEDELLVVMRAYVEKPRSTIGWKGLLHDPHLDGRCDLAAGLSISRSLLIELAGLGLPLASELLTPMAVDYLADTLAWAAIGARTTESQTHRERMSGLDLPVGFKNGTDGTIGAACDAMAAASSAQSYFGLDADGTPAAITTAGNPDTHLILRGGRTGPNYDSTAVARAAQTLQTAGQNPRLIVDCSHGNSDKKAARQPAVLADLVARRRAGERAIAGVMLESNLVDGKQSLGAGEPVYGQSVTDDCLGWAATETALREAAAVCAATTG